MRPDQNRVRTLLTEAVTLLCRNSLQFANELTVEGLIGITMDKKDVFLISINELIQSEKALAKNNQTEEISSESNIELCNTKKSSNEHKEQISSTEVSKVPNIKIEPDEQFSGNSSNIIPNVPPEVKIEKSESVNKVQQFQQKDNSGPSNSCVNSSFSSISSTQEQYQYSYNSQSTHPTQSNSISSNNDVHIKEETSHDDQSFFILDSDEDNDDMGMSDMDISQTYNNQKTEFNWSNDNSNNFLVNENSDPSSQYSQQGLVEGWSNELINRQNFQSGGGGSSSQSMSNSTPSSKVSEYFVAVGDDRYHMCVLCNKYVRKPGLNEHYLRVHTALKAVSCPICDKNFKTKGDLNQHLRVHSDQKLVACPVCSKKFRFRDGLRKHLQTKEGSMCYNRMKTDKK